MHKTISQKLSKEESKELYSKLVASGWKLSPSNNQYVQWSLVSAIGNAMFYTSGKIVLQGDEGIELILSQSNHSSDTKFQPHIGVDEVGKGDYFGPMVVASCFVSEQAYPKLKELGVMDSKKVADKKILELAPNILKLCEVKYLVLKPEEYNKKVEKTNNVSIILARGHSYVIEELLKELNDSNIGCELVVIDQFSKRKSRVVDELGDLGKSIELQQFHKGESDIAVACASIVARARFLEEWLIMDEKYSFKFPKGATHVIDAGKEFVNKYSSDELHLVAKIGFKTTSKIFSLF